MERITQYKYRMKGTTAVELAFTLPFLLILILGALHYGWLFYHLQRVTNATRHAARAGTLVNRSHQDVRDTITAVLDLNGNTWPDYSLDVGHDTTNTVEVVIEDVPMTISSSSQPVTGIRVAINLPTDASRNPHVSLLSKIPYVPITPDYLSASVTMAKE